MDFLERPSPSASIRRASQESDDIEQAGRATSSIYAQRDAVETRRGSTSPTMPSSSVVGSADQANFANDERQSSSLEQSHSLTPNGSQPPKTESLVDPFETESTSLSGDSGSTRGFVALEREDAATDNSEKSDPSERRGSGRGPTDFIPLPTVSRSLLDAPRPEFATSAGSLGDYTRYPVYGRQHKNDMAQSLRSLTNYSTPFSGSVSSLPAVGATAVNEKTEKWKYSNDSLVTESVYFGGEKGFILYPDEIEDDDAYHLPADDDDIVYKANWRDYFHRKAIVSTIGLSLLCLGLLTVLIAFPVAVFGGGWTPSEPENHRSKATPVEELPKNWDYVNNNTYPLLKNVRNSLVDPDTPSSAFTRASTSGKGNLELVFSDEFKTPNRSFWPGDDPFWEAANLWYGSTGDLEYYDPDAVSTNGDALTLQLDSFENHNLSYRSGMVNSWNQLCFKGGIIEMSVSLPGPAGVLGLWPGVWTMGNLGRPGYRATTDGVWPYTYNNCDVGITPNQSTPDGTSWLPGQRLSACTCPNEEHPNPGTGRGAPEIDIFEAGVDYTTFLPIVSQSYQVAPFDIFYSPNSDFMAIPNPEFTIPNPYRGGPYQQAVSATTVTNPKWFDGKAYQKFGFEYTPGDPADGAFITWFVGDDPTFTIDARALTTNGNIGQRRVSEEPMSLTMNLGMSDSWTYINLAGLKFPTTMRIDYVRIYQHKGERSITCDPPGYPTTEYIKNHPVAYENNNVTSWAGANYSWPTNKLMGGC